MDDILTNNGFYLKAFAGDENLLDRVHDGNGEKVIQSAKCCEKDFPLDEDVYCEVPILVRNIFTSLLLRFMCCTSYRLTQKLRPSNLSMILNFSVFRTIKVRKIWGPLN